MTPDIPPNPTRAFHVADITASGELGALESYELSVESGDRMRGKFLVTRLEYAGDFNGERKYTMALESSGEVAAL